MFYSIVILGWLLDICSKYLAEQYVDERISLVWDFVYLELLYNPWIAFWIEVPSFFLKIGTIILIFWIYYYYREELRSEKEEKWRQLLDLSYGLILAGAIGNAWERVLYSRVVDFVWVRYFSVFNLADTFISIWAVFLLYYYYKKHLEK